MAIRFEKLLKLLEEQEYTTYRIRKENLVGQSTLYKLRNNEGFIDTRSINRLCKILNCQPGDIMEYVPDDLDT